MPRLRCSDGKVPTPVLLYISIIIIALVAAGAYVGTRPAEQEEEEEEEVPGEVHSLTITAVSPVTAGQSSSITVEAKDNEGTPVPGLDISLLWDIPGARDEWGVPLALVGQGDGSYTSSLTSQWAGTYTLITSTNTDVVATSQVSFEPGPSAGVVVSSTSPKPALSYYTSTLTFYAVDAHGNIISGDDTTWSINSSFGQAGEVQPNHDDTFSVDISADNWGTAEVTITDGVSGVSGSEIIEFTPAYVDLSYHFVEPTVEISAVENLEFTSSGDSQTLSLDIGIFFPPSLGTLGQYDLRVEYDNLILRLVDITDPDPTDNFEAPEWGWTSDNTIYLTKVGSATEPGVSVATIQFNIWGWVENTWENLKEKAGEIITWVENLWDNLMEPVETPPGTVVVDGKVFKKLFIPLKIWIVDGSGVSDDDARSDAERAEDMLNKNAEACRLKYWYVFLVEINHISEDEWNTKAGADGQLTNDERDNLSRQNRWERWINAYYVPDNALGGALGLWDRSENAIFIDDNADFDNLTLPHELIHELSKSKVKDSPVDNAAAQGARTPGNIMNYDNTGENISENQGKLINETTENNSEERPAGEGGGRIYKPTPYTVEPTLGRVHVAGIETWYEHYEGYSYAMAWVTVVDAEDNPVAGATVIAEVDRPDGTKETESEITGSEGVASISHYTTLYGIYTFTVTDVQVEGMQYDSGSNVVSSASVELA